MLICVEPLFCTGGICQGSSLSSLSSLRAGKVLRQLLNSPTSLHDELGRYITITITIIIFFIMITIIIMDRALGLSPSPYLKKLLSWQKIQQQKGVLKNPANPIKVTIIMIIITITIINGHDHDHHHNHKWS